MSQQVWTIGHWTCPVPDFLSPLDDYGIGLLVDVRAHPGSRRNPQFGRDVMPTWLAHNGIEYVHLPELGGRRRLQPHDADTNAGWQNRSFRAFADYSLTDGYAKGVADLTGLAREHRTALMCGEPMPWRCHRLIIANTLVARGWTVWHLMTGAVTRRHELGQWGAQPVVHEDGTITYPPVAADLPR